jgi:hypothetical protein
VCRYSAQSVCFGDVGGRKLLFTFRDISDSGKYGSLRINQCNLNIKEHRLRARFHFLMATSMKMAVLWDVAPYTLIEIDGGSNHL